MRLIEIRDRVRGIIRNDAYDEFAIDDAVNDVLASINTAGRFRFHENNEDVALVNGTFKYAVTSTIIAEHQILIQPQSSDQAEVTKYPGGITEGIADGAFEGTTGDTPTRYARWKDEWWFDPVPNATAAAKTLRIYHMKDLALLTSDLDPPGINARYHLTVLAYGAAAMIDPNAAIRTGGGAQSVGEVYDKAFNNMIRQETWNPDERPTLVMDDRFAEMEGWGNVV